MEAFGIMGMSFGMMGFIFGIIAMSKAQDVEKRLNDFVAQQSEDEQSLG